MQFSGFEDGDPPSASYTVDDGLEISVVDSAFGEVKVSAFVNRDRINKFFYGDKISYGSGHDDEDEATKEKYAASLLEDALAYQQELEQEMRRVRDSVERQLGGDVSVSDLRTNRESELERSGTDDDSVYAFHVTATYNGRQLRVYVGDSGLRSKESTSVTPFNVRSDAESTATQVSEDQIVSKVEGLVRAWEDQF